MSGYHKISNFKLLQEGTHSTNEMRTAAPWKFQSNLITSIPSRIHQQQLPRKDGGKKTSIMEAVSVVSTWDIVQKPVVSINPARIRLHLSNYIIRVSLGLVHVKLGYALNQFDSSINLYF